MPKDKKKIIIWEDYRTDRGDVHILLHRAQELRKYADLTFFVCEGDPLITLLDDYNFLYRIIGKLSSYSNESSFLRKISLMMHLRKRVSQAEKYFKEVGPDIVYALGAQSILSATVSTDDNKIPVVWHLYEDQYDEGSIKTIRSLSLKKQVKLIFAPTRIMGELSVADLALSKLRIICGVSPALNNDEEEVKQSKASKDFDIHQDIDRQVLRIVRALKKERLL